jgi:hypothetical protein
MAADRCGSRETLRLPPIDNRGEGRPVLSVALWRKASTCEYAAYRLAVHLDCDVIIVPNYRGWPELRWLLSSARGEDYKPIVSLDRRLIVLHTPALALRACLVDKTGALHLLMDESRRALAVVVGRADDPTINWPEGLTRRRVRPFDADTPECAVVHIGQHDPTDGWQTLVPTYTPRSTRPSCKRAPTAKVRVNRAAADVWGRARVECSRDVRGAVVVTLGAG